MKKTLQILFIGMVFFSIGCAKDSGSSASSAPATPSIFPRFSANSLQKSIGGYESPADNSCSKRLNKYAVTVKESVGNLSQLAACSLNKYIDDIEKIFIQGGVKPTTDGASNDLEKAGSYTYTINNKTSTFIFTPYPDRVDYVQRFKIIWSKDDKKISINVFTPKLSDVSHWFTTLNAYQATNGSFDITIEGKNYDYDKMNPKISSIPNQLRQSLYIAYDATSNIFAANVFTLNVDSSTALYDEAHSNSQIFNKQNIVPIDPVDSSINDSNFSFMYIGKTSDSVALAKLTYFYSKNQLTETGDSTNDNRVFCGSDFLTSDGTDDTANCTIYPSINTSPPAAPLSIAPPSVTAAKIKSNAANYNSSKKLTLGFINNDSSFINNMYITDSGILNGTIGSSVHIFKQGATDLSSVYTDLTKSN